MTTGFSERTRCAGRASAGLAARARGWKEPPAREGFARRGVCQQRGVPLREGPPSFGPAALRPKRCARGRLAQPAPPAVPCRRRPFAPALSASRSARRGACGCRAGGRGSVRRAASRRAARSRSTPVAICISASIETRSSVAMLPVAPAGPDIRRARRSSTRSSPRRPRAPRARWPAPARGCCESGRSAAPRRRRARRRAASRAALKSSWTWRGLAIPVVSPKAISCGPGVAQARGDLQHALGRDAALIRAAERRRDHPLAAQPGRAGARQHDLQPLERLGDRAVHVLLVVRLRGRQEDADLVERRALAATGRRAARARSRGRARWERAPRR